ncbi:MAG: YajQ family cyclic di-GMP-binding protein [Pseudanabaenaceae cyanobacterium]
MAATYSFDVVSDFDRQELVNALDQTRREIASRYDLKNTQTEVELQDEAIVLKTDSEMTLGAVVDVLHAKAIKRNLSLKIFDAQPVETIGGNRVSQTLKLQRGLSSELAKKISKALRDNCPKVQPSIQGDAVRVAGKSKDDLQAAIQFLKSQDWPAALQFTNYR